MKISDLTTAITNATNFAVNEITNATNTAVNAANTAVNQAVTDANVAVTQINAALATPGTLQFASAHVVLSAPVSPGVTLKARPVSWCSRLPLR